MYYLPRTLSPDVRSMLEQDLEDLPLEQVLEKVTRSVLQLFEAKDCIFFLYRFTESGREPFASQCATTGTEEQLEKLKDLSEEWLRNGIDDKIVHDFKNRIHCVSYSAFAWPYGSLNTDQPKFSIPRDFTLLLPVNSQLSVSHDSDPGFLGYFAVFFDSFPQLADRAIQLITSLPQTLSDLVLAYLRRAHEPDSQELNVFAHEMKRGLLFVAEGLRRWDPKDPAEEAMLSNLERSVQRLLHSSSAILLGDRVAHSGFQVNRLPLCLNEIIQEILPNFAAIAKSKNATMIVELEANLPLSPIDPALFPTVVENLLENALRYSKPGSSIHLRTRKTENSQVCFEVLDDGEFIPENEWQRIFEKHYRAPQARNIEGNGLGLYLVKRIVEAHEGRVFPRKSEEMKTCFVVELPSMEKI